MKNPYRFVLFIFLLFTSPLIEAQQDNSDRQNYYAETLKKNGVIVTADITTMAYVDVQRIATYNFDSYRAYDKRQQVKLKNGPTVELLSILERLHEGATIDSTIIAKKKDIANSNYKYAIATVVDVMIGYKAPVKQREKTTIFMIPKDNN